MRVRLCALIALVGVVSVAEAGPRNVISRRDAIQPAALSRLLARGELALVESTPEGRSRQVVIFARIGAPPTRVYDTIMNVEGYPKFMRSVIRAEIVRRQGDMFAWDWELNVPVLNLKGRRMVRGKRPHTIELRGVSGHFRDARDRWELFALDGGKATLAALYRTVDITNGGLLLRTMVSLEPSMDHGINVAAGFVNVRDLVRHVEGLPPAKPGRHTGPMPTFTPLAATEDEIAALDGLIKHGELSLIESFADGSLRQVTVLTVVEATRAKLQAIAHAPGTWPEFVPNLTRQDVIEEAEGQLRLEYELEVPLVNVEGVNRMWIKNDGSVDMVAVSGDVARGKWRWEIRDLGARSVPVHYAYTDITQTSWFVKKLVEDQPLFEHGVVVTASTIAVRALKSRAEGRR